MKFENIALNGKIYYQPQDKQRVFHNAILNRAENGYRDFLYGGAARGGKSYSLRWEAHRNCLQYPKLRGLLIRSSFPELERTHLSQIGFDLPASICSYNQQKHTAKYCNDSVLEFGYGTSAQDFQQYLSAEYDFIMIDELTTIPFEFSYLLRSRLSGSRSEFIPFFACATNPGSRAHIDVRNYFVKKSNLDPELYPNYNSDAVFFVPATVYDNKVLLDRDPGEVGRLQQLSKKDQQKYLYGNWDIFEGQFFDEWNPEIHVIKSEDYLPYDKINSSGFTMLAGMDYGNDTFVYYGYRDYNDSIVIFDEFWDVKSTRQVKIANQVKFQAERGLINIPIEADTNMFIKDAFDVDASNSPAEEYIEAGLNLYRVSKASTDQRGYRIQCWDALKNMLHWKMDDGKLTVPPKIKIYARCHKLIDSLPALIADEKNIEDIADGQYDHPVDALKMLVMSLRLPVRPKENLIPEYLQIKLNKHKYKNLSVMSE